MIWAWGDTGTTKDTHNIREDHKLFYSGALTNDNIDGFDVQASAGTYHYYCEHHGSASGGMDGVIKSKPRKSDVPPGPGLDEFEITWAYDTDTGDRFDVQYRVNGGDWRNWKNDTANFSGIFGHNDRPLDVQDGNTYTFRVRTEKSSNVDVRRSRWSPKLSVEIPTGTG